MIAAPKGTKTNLLTIEAAQLGIEAATSITVTRVRSNEILMKLRIVSRGLEMNGARKKPPQFLYAR